MSESDDGNEGVTMLDVLEEHRRLDEQVRLVLGGSDDTNCTYPQGYAKRQALYACMTCNPPDKTSRTGGVCLACSMNCHEGHDMVELYTKRNFRCDCGNSRFPDNQCKLEPNKDATNEGNTYNQNFKGRYCVCGKPYPDPDVDVQSDMIQCSVCEDWFHREHLNNTQVPSDEEEFELICVECVKKHDFLRGYEIGRRLGSGRVQEHGKKRKHSDNSPSGSRSGVPQGGSCKVRKSPASGVPQGLFLADGWREGLCRCKTCLQAYKVGHLEFLLDPEDTLQAYEQKGREKCGDESTFTHALEALTKLERGTQIELLACYNDMKEQLDEFLKTFEEQGRVVREEDVEKFFDDMDLRKRRRLD